MPSSGRISRPTSTIGQATNTSTNSTAAKYGSAASPCGERFKATAINLIIASLLSKLRLGSTDARQAKNHNLEAAAIEIRMRATRRMDQMRQGQKATLGFNRGAQGVGTKVAG